MQTTRGKLHPLKTALEIRSCDKLVDFYITVVPVKQSNTVLKIVRQAIPNDGGLDIQHLRRFAKLADLPPEVRATIAAARHVSPTITNTDTGEEEEGVGERVLLVGSINASTKDTLTELLAPVLETLALVVIQVPFLTPTSQEQATRWTARFWPTVYKKSNLFGPHPSLANRAMESIAGEVENWLGLAEEVAADAHEEGRGERVGVVVVERIEGVGRVLAVAADARWLDWPRETNGNVSAHAAMRGVGIVAVGLKAKENLKSDTLSASSASLPASIFRDEPIGETERAYFQPSDKKGYLCHELEIYCTHEPCVMCAMAIVHSRFGKLVFRRKMQRTGGVCADGELGHGLFWRKELNWTMLGWQWCPDGEDKDGEGAVDVNLNA
ncbi:cytidine deaminase-like protein [Calycina marina]|uniref:Cytidine deaminase-like protein n=1 Tax=Calycina marina TaxID=1763456 RepID=A0A9P7Z239_9HELO|nr:cytidine deaminase-like protein [Calycina marina]